MVHDTDDLEYDAVECPSYEDVCASKPDYARSVKIQFDEQDAVRGKAILQRHGKRILVQNPPAKPLTTEEMDHVYALPYMRTYHPSYEAARRRACHSGGTVLHHPQPRLLRRVQFLRARVPSGTLHSGAQPRERDRGSKKITQMPGFKGYIHDVGGPTANFRFPACKNRRNTAAARTSAACSPPPARTSKQTTPTTLSCCASCAASRA